MGQFSRATFNFVNDVQPGQPSNQVAKFEGVYGCGVGQDHWARDCKPYPLLAERPAGGQQGLPQPLHVRRPRPPDIHGRLSGHRADFVSSLGFIPDVNLRGSTVSMEQYNSFDRGRLRVYDVSASADTYQYHTGGFFQNDVNGNVYLEAREGLSYDLNYDLSRRNDFHDHALDAQFGWGRRTLYQRGKMMMRSAARRTSRTTSSSSRRASWCRARSRSN